MNTLRSRLRGIYYALTSEAVPLHRGESVYPFFVVGSGRCGTTLLRRILQASREIHIPPENWILGKVIRRFHQHNWLLSWEQTVETVVAAHEYRTHWFDAAASQVMREAQNWKREQRSLQRLLDRLYCFHGENEGAVFDRWGDKTPMNINHMEAILKVFPQAQFVHMLRDGVDVIHSWLEHGLYKEDIKNAAHRWKQAVAISQGFGNKHPDRIIEVRYEELCQNPEKVVRDLCNFLSIQYEDDLLSRSDHHDEMRKAQSVEHFQNAFKSITTDSIGKGRKALTGEQKRKVAPIIKAKVIRLGYDPL